MKSWRVSLVVGILIALGTRLPSQEKKDGPPVGVVIDKEARTITIDCKMAPRKVFKGKDDIYPLEVIATWPYPKGKKAHETIVTIDEAIKPSAVHKALEALGLKAGKPVQGEGEPKGPAVSIYFLIPDSSGLAKKVTIDRKSVV